MIRRAALAAVLAGLVLAAGTGARLIRVHHDYGVWAPMPGARTPTLPYGGRTYLLGGDAGPVPAGTTRLAGAPGGGTVFGAGATPTLLFVRYPDGSVATYALSGGP